MFKNLKVELKSLLQENLSDSEFEWLSQAVDETKRFGSARKLYLNYSLSGAKIKSKIIVDFDSVSEDLKKYLLLQEANTLEISRIWMLSSVLGPASSLVEPVKNLIQIADTSELETFLKYLVLLPNAENYQFAAVEALRTNISTVFDAISRHNPYPATYFSDQQWNQMFLKAAFMQQDLGTMVAIDERANADLARIISDYAHERWAASRDIDPLFWRPVSNFLNDGLVEDVKRLFESEKPTEKSAAALVCYNSKLTIAKDLLNNYPALKSEIESGTISWEKLKN